MTGHGEGTGGVLVLRPWLWALGLSCQVSGLPSEVQLRIFCFVCRVLVAGNVSVCRSRRWRFILVASSLLLSATAASRHFSTSRLHFLYCPGALPTLVRRKNSGLLSLSCSSQGL